MANTANSVRPRTATVLAVTVLGRTEFAVFATAYFLCQVPLLLAAVLLFRGSRAARGVQIGADES